MQLHQTVQLSFQSTLDAIRRSKTITRLSCSSLAINLKLGEQTEILGVPLVQPPEQITSGTKLVEQKLFDELRPAFVICLLEKTKRERAQKLFQINSGLQSLPTEYVVHVTVEQIEFQFEL